MSKQPKSNGGKPHPHPNSNTTRAEEQGTSGNVHVRGEVTVVFGPEESNARNTTQKKRMPDAIKYGGWRSRPSLSCSFMRL
jgi:hypothetical protein